MSKKNPWPSFPEWATQQQAWGKEGKEGSELVKAVKEWWIEKKEWERKQNDKK